MLKLMENAATYLLNNQDSPGLSVHPRPGVYLPVRDLLEDQENLDVKARLPQADAHQAGVVQHRGDATQDE